MNKKNPLLAPKMVKYSMNCRAQKCIVMAQIYAICYFVSRIEQICYSEPPNFKNKTIVIFYTRLVFLRSLKLVLI